MNSKSKGFVTTRIEREISSYVSRHVIYRLISIYTHYYIHTADEDEDGVGAEDDESINDSASEVGWNSDDDYAFAHVVGKKRKNVRLFH